MCGGVKEVQNTRAENKYFTAVRELYTHAKLKRSSQQACFGLAMNASQPSAVSQHRTHSTQQGHKRSKSGTSHPSSSKIMTRDRPSRRTLNVPPSHSDSFASGRGFGRSARTQRIGRVVNRATGPSTDEAYSLHRSAYSP